MITFFCENIIGSKPRNSFFILSLEIEVTQFFGQQKPVDVNAYDKSLVEKLRLLEELDDTEKRTVFSVIDIAIAKKRLKDTLSNVL